MGKKTNTNGIADSLSITKVEFKRFWRTVQGLVDNPSLSHAAVESAINQCHQNGIEQPTPDDAADIIVPERKAKRAARQAELAVQQAQAQQDKCRKNCINLIVMCIGEEIKRRQGILQQRQNIARQRQDKLRTCRKKSALVVEVDKATKELRSIFAADLQRRIEETQKVVDDKLVAADNRVATAEKALDGLKKRVIQLEKAKKPTASETPPPPTPPRKSLLSLRDVDATKRWGFWKNIYLPSLKSLPDQDAFWKFRNDTDGGKGQLQPNQLDQYIAAYGGHHYHKLRNAFDRADFASYCQQTIEIIDWGCGQAIATCVLLDYLLEKNIKASIAKITLIEPSQDAIDQGVKYLQNIVSGCVFSKNTVESYATTISNITPATISSDPKNNKIHLFSNILDVPSVNLQYLHQVVCASQSGLNKFICVSPNHPTLARLDNFRNRFSQQVVGKEFCEVNQLVARVYNHVKPSPYTPGTWADNYEIDRYERQFTIVI